MISMDNVTKRNKWSVLSRFVLIGGVSLAIIFAGCSDNGLVYNSSPDDDQVSFFDQPFYDDALAKRADIVDVDINSVESSLKAALGGVIALGQDEDNEAFVVMPGSFPADTTFTVEISKIVTANGESLVVYEFGPDGLQFSRSAVLRLNLAELFGKSVKAMELYWLNEEINEWEFQGVFQADEQQVACASIKHFSSYGIGASGTGTDAAK